MCAFHSMAHPSKGTIKAAITCSKLIETLKQDVKYVQS